MREYVLMTDSCCDLPDQMARELQLEVLPLTMHMDGQDYPNTLDGAAISNEEFYRRIRAGKMATTSAVNVGQFEDAMSACIAAESVRARYPEGRIRVIDSLSASLGQGLLMYLTARKKLREAPTMDELGDWVEANKLHICHWFTVNDLNYLKKGGRVSAATAFVGTMLSIKPIMHTSDEGKLTVVGKARGRKSSLNTLIDTVGRLGIDLQEQTMFICQADCQAEAEAVAAELKRRPRHHGPVLRGNGALTMKWLELKIDAAPAGLDPVSALLEDLGITGLVIDDEGDFRDFLEHNRAYWDYVDDALMQEKKGLCRITFYLEDTPDGYNTLSRVRMALSRVKQEHPEYGSLLLTMENMEDADWENNWKQFYKPMEIGERLIVVPEWEQANTQGRIPLILNPGLTFGTGSHATTRLCLTALEETIHGGERVLDLGCGSGILSIAALRLGADRAVACDIDEKCMDVAYENAALNGVGRDRYTVRWGDVVTDRALRRELGGPYDVVVANIVADVIKALASTVRPLVREGGIFLCSGIIDDRAEEVAQCLRDNGWTIAETRSSEGWFSYLCR